MKIGVLGGIGPEATGIFYLKLVKALQDSGAVKENADFPQIFINSINAPELVFSSIGDADLSAYEKGLKELDRMKPDFIVMVCNTIHLFYERLQSCIKSPIVNLKKEVFAELKKRNVSCAAVMGTPSTVGMGLYSFEGIAQRNPDEHELLQLGNAVFDFNRGFEKERQAEKARRAAEKCIAEGAQAVILGCTEFAVMLKDEMLPKIDTIEVLANAAAERCLDFR